MPFSAGLRGPLLHEFQRQDWASYHVRREVEDGLFPTQGIYDRFDQFGVGVADGILLITGGWGDVAVDVAVDEDDENDED